MYDAGDRLDPDLPTLNDALSITDAGVALLGQPDRHGARTYGAVEFYEEGTPTAFYRDHVVLGAGLPSLAVDEVRKRLAQAGAAALVIRAGSEPGAVDAYADNSSLALLNLREGDWAQLATTLRSLLSAFAIGHVRGVRLGDLFGLANVLATLSDGAVSIVDSTGQVVGYSTHADQPIDDIRRRTTLMLQEEIPSSQDPDYQAIRRAADAMHFPTADDQFGRVGTAVRAAGELLGSIWVVQTDPATASHTQMLLDEMAPIAAQHLLTARDATADQDRRNSELLRALVENEGHSHSAASQLLIRPEAESAVVCFRVNTYDEVAAARGLHRLLLLVRSLATSSFTGSHSAIIGPQVVTLIPSLAPARVRSFAESVIRNDAVLIAGVGTHAADIPTIKQSYREAVATAALLMTTPPHDASEMPTRLASFDEIRDLLAIRQIGDVIDQLDVSVGDAASQLLDHDRRQNTDLSSTMLTYLNLHGSVRETAQALHVHQNTVRYRLDVVRNEFGIELDKPATRLWLWLRLVNHS